MNVLATTLPKRPMINPIKDFSKTLSFLNQYSTDTNLKKEIVIPKRIPRGPTDILRALESTIKKDPTAAHYKYHDDPFLIPMSNLGKRTFAMAQESGRKAAHWVRQQHADLFQHCEAEPMIEEFIPKMVYNENSTVTEEDLLRTINQALVSDAITIYEILKSKNIAMSPQTQQNLLELICYYNQEDPLPEEFIEERWFRQSAKGKERQRKTWRDGMLAEELFIGMETPTAEVYSAIIQGMTKYGQVDRAWQLFEESQQKGVAVSTEAYNSLISVASYLKEGYDMRWNFVIDILSTMRRAELTPNLGTLNAILKTLSTMGGGKMVKENGLLTLSEFKSLGIEPSLATWYYVLITFCKERGPTNPVLHDIMDQLEGKVLKIRDIRDTFFFATAMDICHYHLHDSGLARRVNNLLHTANNYDLIGDSYKESIYYRHYVALLCKAEPLEEFMETVYHKLVPHIYVPEPSVMEEILKAVEASDAIQYVPKLWSDMIIFDHIDRENLVTLVLDIMVNNKPPPNSVLTERFSVIAWDMFKRITEQNQNRTKKLSVTGDMLGKILVLLLENNDFENACEVMDTLDKNQQTVLGVPGFECLSLFVDHCIEKKLPNRAIDCIQYAADNGFEEAPELVIKLNKSLTLDERYLERLSKIVGPDVLENREIKS